MKRSRIFILVLFTIMLFSTTVVYAEDEVVLVPDITIESAVDPDSDEYPMHHYMFDTEKLKALDVLPSALKALTSGLFFVNVLISKLVNFLLAEAFTLNIFDYISDVFDDIIFSLRDSVFTPFLKVILPIAGISIIFFGVVNKGTKAIQLFIQTIVILVVSYSFMAAPSLVITMVNSIARDMSGETLAATAKVVTGSAMTSNDAVVNMSNIYWDTAVRNPWEIIQFGETVDSSTAEKYLELQPGSQDRIKLGEDEENFMFKKSYQVIRLAIVFFLLIVNLIMGALIIVLSGLMFITQFAAIIAAVIAVLGFLISLLPNMGLRVAVHAIYNIFEFLLARLGVTLLLCTYFAIASVLYKSANEIGWFLVMIMQLVLIAAIILYRKKIFSFVYATTKGSQAAMSAIHSKPDKDAFARTAFKAYGYAKIGQEVKQMWGNRQDKKLDKQYKPTAEKYLYKKYGDEKKQAERVARDSGEEVQYSDFVKQTDARVERGFTPFSVDDVDGTTKMMKNLHKQGEDPDRLVMTTVSGKTDNEIRHDQRYLERRIGYTKDGLKGAENKNEHTYNRVIRTDRDSEFYNRRTAILESAKQYGSAANKQIGMGMKEIFAGNMSAPTEFMEASRTEAPGAVEPPKSEQAAAVEPITADGSMVQQMPKEMGEEQTKSPRMDFLKAYWKASERAEAEPLRSDESSIEKMREEMGGEQTKSPGMDFQTSDVAEVQKHTVKNSKAPIDKVVEKEDKTENVKSNIQNTSSKQTSDVVNKQDNINNEEIEKTVTTQNVSEDIHNVTSKEINKVVDKQVSSKNETIEREVTVQKVSETVHNVTSKEINNTIETVNNREGKKTEKVEKEASNKSWKLSEEDKEAFEKRLRVTQKGRTNPLTVADYEEWRRKRDES